MAVAKRRYLDIMLGLFVAAGIALLATFIFVIGKERRLFDISAHVSAYFPNVAGLAVGAEVLLGGVVVGHVNEIVFPPLRTKDPKAARQIKVVMRISRDMLPWIRQDSVARIDSKGLLGDKTINITLGSADVPPMADGSVLQSIPPLDFNEALGKAQIVLDNVTDAVISARKLLEGFTKQGGDVALADAAQALKNIVREIETGKGIVHNLIYDKKSGQDFGKAVSGVNDTIASIKDIFGEVKEGEGFLHAMVYDKKGDEVVRLANEILADINAILKEVRAGPGVLHSLVYDTSQGNLVANLNAAAADIKAIIASVKSGQGTLGRLLVDPSVYDDLKLILGQVRRNEVLKALVRFSISRQGSEPAEEKPPVIEQR